MSLSGVDAQIQADIDALTLSSTPQEIARVASAAAISSGSFNRTNLFRVIDVVAKTTNDPIGRAVITTARTLAGNITPKVMGHGNVNLLAGTMQAGYFGEVSSTELFRGDDLALELGVDQGVLQNEDAGWLKFAWRGQIIYIAKRSFMHSVSWDHLYSRGIVYGTDDNGAYPRGTATNQYTSVEKDNFEYVVGLMTGAASDPIDTSERAETHTSTLGMGAGSEWNELIYRVHQDIPVAPNGLTFDGGAQFGENWAEFTDSDLNITGNGRWRWCQETASESTSSRVLRGLGRLSNFARFTASLVPTSLGWCPRLVLKS